MLATQSTTRPLTPLPPATMYDAAGGWRSSRPFRSLPSVTHDSTKPEESPAPNHAEPAARGEPLWTFALETRPSGTPATAGLLGIIAMFWLATLACGGASFTPALVRLGAQVPGLAQPWRLLSYAFLHGSWEHLGMNAFALWRIGRPLEQLLGTARFVALYSWTALAGGLATLLVSNGLSVGASGALWGMLGAEAVLVLGPRPTLPAPVAQKGRALVVQNLLLNVVISFLPRVNAAAHFGGGIVGTIMMLTVLAPGLPRWGAGGRQPGTVPPWLGAFAWLSGSALVASGLIAVIAGRPWALAAPGPTVEVRLPSGHVIAVPAQLKARPEKDGTFIWGDLLEDPVVVTAEEVALSPEKARQHPDTLLGSPPEDTRIVEPPALVQHGDVTVVAARYAHKSGTQWESAVALPPASPLVRIDVLLHPDARPAWRGLAAQIAASVSAEP